MYSTYKLTFYTDDVQIKLYCVIKIDWIYLYAKRLTNRQITNLS